MTPNEVQTAFATGLNVAEGHLGWTGVAQGVGENGQSFVNVPIVVPPGRAGVEPSLALSYDSGAGDGPMGVGWRLSGLGQIARCAHDVGRDGARNERLFDEGVSDGPFDENAYATAALCLDGERLMKSNLGTPEGPSLATFVPGVASLEWTPDKEVILVMDVQENETKEKTLHA